MRPAQSELGRAVDVAARVVDVEDVGGGTLELTLYAPEVAARARAGEFVQLRVGDGIAPLLRRPMSVAWSGDDGTLAVVFAVVGAGTRRLAAARPGDHLDVLGPLGSGFSMPAPGTRLVCVAGGLGCAPFPLTARDALAAGASRVTVLSGAATAARLYPAHRYARGDGRVEVVECTDDGSRGSRGVVTALVADEVARGDVGAVLACGPNPMLGAVAAVLAALPPVPIAEVSLEAPMGCGFGTCLGCALPVLDEGGQSRWALCCRQGPAMPVATVDWEGMRALPPPHVA